MGVEYCWNYAKGGNLSMRGETWSSATVSTRNWLAWDQTRASAMRGLSHDMDFLSFIGYV